MNTWKVILATMVIFGTGVITGGLLVSHSDRINPINRPLVGPRVRPAEPPHIAGIPQLPEQKPQFVARLHRELNLAPDQLARIHKIIGNGQVRTKQLWDKVAPQMREEMQEVREEIRAELTLEQKIRFEELLKQHLPRKPGEPPMQDRRLRDPRRPIAPPPGHPPPSDNP